MLTTRTKSVLHKSVLHKLHKSVLHKSVLHKTPHKARTQTVVKEASRPDNVTTQKEPGTQAINLTAVAVADTAAMMYSRRI